MRPERPPAATPRLADDARTVHPPAPNEVHVWVADLEPAPGEAARRMAATSDVERERASRFRRREDADRYLSAHGVLRLILADYLACGPLALRFSTRANGKPDLEDGRLAFNLSHSGALALIAVARRRQVGIDVELVRPVPDLQSLAVRVCTPEELQTLATLAEPHRERAFFAMWTRKEALAKATGEGIGAIVGDVHHAPEGVADRWTLVEITDLPGYAACVAAEGSGWQLVRRNVTGSNGGR